MRPLARVEDRISIEFFLLVRFSWRRAIRVLLSFLAVTCGNFRRRLETFGEFRVEGALSSSHSFQKKTLFVAISALKIVGAFFCKGSAQSSTATNGRSSLRHSPRACTGHCAMAHAMDVRIEGRLHGRRPGEREGRLHRPAEGGRHRVRTRVQA